jgi:hypothetical protein
LRMARACVRADDRDQDQGAPARGGSSLHRSSIYQSKGSPATTRGRMDL